MDLHGRYRWLAFRHPDHVEASTVSYRTAEEAYAAAMQLPLTVVARVREGDAVREVSRDDALAVQNDGQVEEFPDVGAAIQRLRERGGRAPDRR
jgi:hypothetical protein